MTIRIADYAITEAEWQQLRHDAEMLALQDAVHCAQARAKWNQTVRELLLGTTPPEA